MHKLPCKCKIYSREQNNSKYDAVDAASAKAAEAAAAEAPAAEGGEE